MVIRNKDLAYFPPISTRICNISVILWTPHTPADDNFKSVAMLMLLLRVTAVRAPVNQMIEHQSGELLGVRDQSLQLLHRQVHEGGVGWREHSPGPGCGTSTNWKRSIQRVVITEKAPTRAFSWLKAATTAFTFKTLFRHYAKRALTPRFLNVKLGPQRNYHEGRAAIRHYANQTALPLW